MHRPFVVVLFAFLHLCSADGGILDWLRQLFIQPHVSSATDSDDGPDQNSSFDGVINVKLNSELQESVGKFSAASNAVASATLSAWGHQLEAKSQLKTKQDLEHSLSEILGHETVRAYNSDDEENPKGVVVNVRLNSELQLKKATVVPLTDQDRAVLQTARFEARGKKDSGSKDFESERMSVFRQHASLLEVSYGIGTSSDGIVDDVKSWFANKLSGLLLIDTAGGDGEDSTQYDNPDGAIVNVRLNSELQQQLGQALPAGDADVGDGMALPEGAVAESASHGTIRRTPLS